MTHYGDTKSWKEEAEALREQLAAERKRREEVEARLADALALAQRQDAAHMEARAALTRRAEKAEDLWHAEQQAHTAAVTRAEMAERERDEARRDKRDMGGIISRTMDALEGDPDDNMVGLARARMGDLQRAEADNAEYIRALNVIEHLIISGRPEEARQEAINVMEPDHPGAAMLERMRALESFAEKVREHEWQRTDWQGFCLFRRVAGCDATDGVRSGFGSPRGVRPHSEACPFHVLDALKPT